MLIKTHKYFNQSTRMALLDHVHGYVDKFKSIHDEIRVLKRKFGIQKVYRFDLGENVDGFSPRVKELLENVFPSNTLYEKLNEYPNITHRTLRQEIAEFQEVSRDQIVISTGLDSILDLITRVFIDYGDSYLMPVPDFFLFENYSERMGGNPIFLPLEEKNNFRWTRESTDEFRESIIRFKPKIVWISNPGNPTGQILPSDTLHELIKISHANNVFIVIDEAYGEYIMDKNCSAVKHVDRYPNLMVLRTFSKAYGLAGIRIGYLMSSSRDIVNALLLHRHHFPATQIGLDIASVALKDQSFIEHSISQLERRKVVLFNKLSSLKLFKYIPSSTNVFMLRNNYLSNENLAMILKQHGIFTSLSKITGVENKSYLRLTIRNTADNDYLYQVCQKIESEIFQSVKVDENECAFI